VTSLRVKLAFFVQKFSTFLQTIISNIVLHFTRFFILAAHHGRLG
jgi:hypothetical protein